MGVADNVYGLSISSMKKIANVIRYSYPTHIQLQIAQVSSRGMRYSGYEGGNIEGAESAGQIAASGG